MPTVIADRVKVTTTTTGTGTLTLGSAVTGFQDFGVIGDGNETYYTISVPGGADFEVGIGTFTASGTTLSRDTILTSSNGGLAVNLSAGTKDVFVTYPAERSVVSLEGNNSEFPAGTRMIFAQTTAPTGFTKDATNYNNHALRVVTGTAATGGTVDFVTAFASQTPTGTVTVTGSTGQVAQAGNIAVSTGQVIQGGNVSSPASTGLVTQGGNVSSPASTGLVTQGGNVSVSGNVSTSIGNTTLAVPTIPAHSHPTTGFWQNGPGNPRFPNTGGAFAPAPTYFSQNNETNNTGGSGAHAHPAGSNFSGSGSFSGSQHSHPVSVSSSFSGVQHSHPVSVTSTFSGVQHAHPASGTFTGSQHDHPVSAPASFSGSAINLAVKYLDVITATKD
jgi:hypothetical protein